MVAPQRPRVLELPLDPPRPQEIKSSNTGAPAAHFFVVHHRCPIRILCTTRRRPFPVVPAAQSLYFARSVGDTPLVSDHVLLFYLVRLLYHQEICPHGAPAQYLDRGAPWSRTWKPPKRCSGGAGSTWKCRHLTGTPRASPVAMWGEPRPGCF